jgi:hypothetical protein
MIKPSLVSRAGRVSGLILIFGLACDAPVRAADSAQLRDARRDIRGFEGNMDRLDQEERALRKGFETDRIGLNRRCENDEKTLRERYRRERNRLEREIAALHDRCRSQRRALTRSFEQRKQALNHRREGLHRSRREDVRDLRHSEPPMHGGPTGRFDSRHEPASKDLPPGLERYEEKHGGQLPPGLQKQLDEKGHLPPGLEKRR